MFSDKFVRATADRCDYDHWVPAPLFRRSFTVERKPDSAVLTICGLGFYELYLNGERITKGALAPYISNPDDILYYDRYDISDRLLVGENVLGVMLGNGMMNCFGGSVWDFDRAAWRAAPQVAFSLELDGEVAFEADERVRTAPSPILLDDLRIGAFYDARQEQDGWNDVGFDDRDWQPAQPAERTKGEARLCEAEPVTVYKELQPVAILHYDDFCYCCQGNAAYENELEQTRVHDAYVYDFGENNSGVCRLKIRGQAGQTVTLRFGEMMVDGRFSLRSTIFVRPETMFYLDYPQMDRYTLKGDGEEEFVPPFTYHGFRYVLVEGITPEQATKELLTYQVISSGFATRGHFACSDATINALTAMTERADRANFVYIPTDCPHREKNGWTADAALSAAHMLEHMDAGASMKEWMRNIAKAQRADGALPGIIPTGGWGFEWGNGPAWDCICVYYPYYVYKYDGDTAIIAENRELICRYLRYIAGRRDADGLVAIGLGDWCQPKAPGNGQPWSPLRLTDSAMTLDIARKAALLFDAIHDEEAKCLAQTLADEMRAAIRAHLIDWDTVTVIGECQTSQTLGISFDIFDESEKPRAFERLMELIRAQEDHMVCGVIGARHIFHVLAANGQTELACRMITRQDFPAYGQWIAEGNTTLCETFNDVGRHKDSRNHHFWGDIRSFFVQYLAGLQVNPEVRDALEFVIAPQFVPSLSSAEASFDSAQGTVATRWERQNDTVRLAVNVPQAVHGDIRLPDGWHFADGTGTKPLTSGMWILHQ